MKLYHGSNSEVTEIDLAKSRVGKDFGVAFYLSYSIQQAREMAQFKVNTFGGEIYVSEFEFDEHILDTSEVNYIDFPTFLQRIKYPVGITFQWAFCTQKAISFLKYQGQCK